MHSDATIECLRRGRVLAASILPSGHNNLAWIGVYPLDLASPMTLQFLRNQGLATLRSVGRAFHIRLFEVKKELIEADACIAESELLHKRSYFAFGEEDLARKLKELGIMMEQLDISFRVDYPI